MTWSSSDPAVATVGAAGLVTAVGNGSVTVTATAGSASGTAAVTVAQQVGAVAILPDGGSVVERDTVRFEAQAADTNGRPVAGAGFSWASSDTLVAVVDDAGLVTGVGAGEAEVTATAQGVTGRAELTVIAAVPTTLTVAPDTVRFASLGDTVRLVAEVRDQLARVMEGHPVAWSSSDASVATVDGTGLVAATGNGTATITASAGEASASATVIVRQAVSAVDLEIDSLTVSVGETLRLAAIATDANGHTVTGAAIKWSSSAPNIVSVDATGLIRGTSRGTAVVTASSGAAADSATVTVHDPSLVTVTRVEPMVLVEGRAATVHGWGFSPLAGENEVLVGGLPAPVLSSTATRLSITVPRADCLPPREVLLRVSTTAGRDSVAIGSTPLSEEDRNWPRFEWRHTSGGDGCIHLPGIAGGGEFLIGVTSVSEDPSHLAPVTLAGKPGDASILAASEGSAVPRAGRVAYSRYPAPLVPASGRAGPPPSVAGRRGSGVPRRRGTAWSDWFAGQAEAMARNQALLRELGRPDWSAGPSQAAVARSSLSKGDTVTLKTGWNAETLVDVRSVVRFVGDHMVWLDDVANPGEPFTDAELMEQDAFYSSHVKPVNEAYFGSLSDVDGNGRFLVLMTVEMNRRGMTGEVNPCHQFPRSQCHFSNEAEFMAIRAPDPDGLYGHAVSREAVLSFLPYFLAHEVTHIVQYSETLLAGLPRKRGWELEGGADMAVELVGYRLSGHASGQDLGYAEWMAGGQLYESWLRSLFGYFSGGRGAPEECTWLTYRGAGGNDGPCAGSLNYGVGALMHRFAMDRWGGSYPGGEKALLKRLTQSPLIGFANLVDVSPGWSIERILAEFYVTLWLEGTAGRDTPGMTSWDLHDIVSRFDAEQWLKPYSSSSPTPSVSARIRGASTMYFHWTPDGPLRPTSFKVEPADDGPVFVWAIRAR